MAFQATVALFGLASSAATAAVLCALAVMWWALVLCVLGADRQVVGTLQASAKELKPDPFVNDAPTPLLGEQKRAEAVPADLDLGIDFEAFHSQIRHEFEAFKAQIGCRSDLIFQDLGIDLEASQAQIGRRCDLELDALCETAMDDQSVNVLQDLQDEFRGSPVGGAQARRQPASQEPRMDFEANVELHCNRSLEGMRSHGIDAIDGALGDYALEMEEALSGQAAEAWVTEARSMNADGTFDVTFEDERLLRGNLGYVN